MDGIDPTRLDPADVPIRRGDAPEPERPAHTTGASYARQRSKAKRSKGGLRTIPTTNRPKVIPKGIRLVTDGAGREWTDVYGAAVLGGIARRTVYQWKHRGWLQVRYMASGKLEILVESLWWSEKDRAQVVAAAAVPAALAGDAPDEYDALADELPEQLADNYDTE